MPSRIRSAVFFPNPLSFATSPDAHTSASACSSWTPSFSWMVLTRLAPRPGIPSISINPGGVAASSWLCAAISPVSTSSVISATRPLPIPRTAPSSPRWMSTAADSSSVSTRLAALANARHRNGFSPFSSISVAICSNTAAISLLSICMSSRASHRKTSPVHAKRRWSSRRSEYNNQGAPCTGPKAATSEVGPSPKSTFRWTTFGSCRNFLVPQRVAAILLREFPGTARASTALDSGLRESGHP